VAAGCASPNPHASAPASAASDQTDVWFMQHMVPHLWQATSIAFLTRDRITHPVLIRVADAINQRGQADIQQLQEWLSQRGLAPHGHSHQRSTAATRPTSSGSPGAVARPLTLPSSRS
jgi:uncharacterized protein (DUF305 family)